jgi:mannose-6-phosphate isomerase-like protein (cupin superfamily)
MQKIVNKSWGYEIWIENNDLYCGKHLHVVPNKYCSIHYHKNKKETFYVIGGELKLEYCTNTDPSSWKDEKYNIIVLKKGQSFTLETFTTHRFTSNTDYACDFIEISTYHDDDDSYRLNI